MNRKNNEEPLSFHITLQKSRVQTGLSFAPSTIVLLWKRDIVLFRNRWFNNTTGLELIFPLSGSRKISLAYRLPFFEARSLLINKLKITVSYSVVDTNIEIGVSWEKICR